MNKNRSKVIRAKWGGKPEKMPVGLCNAWIGASGGRHYSTSFNKNS